MIKNLLTILLAIATYQVIAQSQPTHIGKLELGKKEKKVFKDRDSSLVIHIDTLILKDKAVLGFYGLKEVKLSADYIEVGKDVLIYGTDGKNNASNFEITANFQKIGALYILAKGENAFNGTKTYPNGNGGNVILRLQAGSIQPQSTDKKAKNYLKVDTQAGGKSVNAEPDLRYIYSRIQQAPAGLRGLPQGQIYSGSPGRDGTYELILSP